MYRYGRDYPREFGSSPYRSDRYDRAFRGYGSAYTDRQGSTWDTYGRSPYFDQPGREIGPRYEGYGYPMEQEAWGEGTGSYETSRGWTGAPEWGGQSDVDRVTVSRIMTENPEAVTSEATLADVAKRMRDLDVGIIPVIEDEESYRLKGVITDRDIVVRAAAEGKDLKKAKVGGFMTEEVETVHPQDHVRDVFTVMKRDQVRRVPVVDDQGRLVGIIAQADLAVDYAGLDVEREGEVEEVIERISEPARPRRGVRGDWGRGWSDWQGPNRYAAGGYGHYDRDFTDRLRSGWRTVRRGARHLLDRAY